jgi:hypothetical protein
VFIMGCAWLVPSTPLAVILAVLFVYGTARSLLFTTLATLAYADVADAQKAAASTLMSVAQQMAIGMGIAFGALCLRIAASTHGGADPGVAFVLPDFHWALGAASALTLVSVIGYLHLSREAGSAIGGGSRRGRVGGRVRKQQA